MVMVVMVASASPAVAAPSAKMKRALKLYEARKYPEAGILLHQLAERGNTPEEKQRAEWWLAKTLYHQGFYWPCLSFLDRIVRRPKGKYRLAAVKWLIALTDKLPNPTDIQHKLGKSFKTDLTRVPMLRRLRDPIRYHLGRYRYEKGSFKEAVALLAAVDPKSALYPKARLLEGFVHVRTMKAKPAARAFKAALRAALAPPGSKDKRIVAELAVLSLARVFYSVGQHKLAVKYYTRVSKSTPRRATALLERAWALFKLGQHKRAMTDLRAARADRAIVTLESYPLEAVIYFQNCRYHRSRATARRFVARLTKAHKQLEHVGRTPKDPTDFYDVALRILDRRANLKGDVARLARLSLDNRKLRKHIAHVNEIDRELKLVRAAPPWWKSTALAGVVLQDLSLIRSLAVAETGQVAQLRIKRQARELKTLLDQAQKVAAEAAARLKQGKPPAGCNKL